MIEFDNLCFIGIIVSITRWWIMTLFAYWKGMLVFILDWRTNKAKGTLLQELQSKYDTSWMAYSGWIHIKPIIKPIYRNIQFLEYFVHFRLFTQLDIHQANHQAYISKSIPFWNTSSISFVWSVCCDSLPIAEWKMSWLEMGVDDRIC